MDAIRAFVFIDTQRSRPMIPWKPFAIGIGAALVPWFWIVVVAFTSSSSQALVPPAIATIAVGAIVAWVMVQRLGLIGHFFVFGYSSPFFGTGAAGNNDAFLRFWLLFGFLAFGAAAISCSLALLWIRKRHSET